ncbi:hypothetical protein A3D06_00190 [Candidatus Roizmanbacteria bacterium RIFCSPHIGHO2_02_FULL_40_9]|uniref:Bacterial toxin RNase RnlA/LsoA DBD domain-containing protein n=2 Tax=Candidatus Roizmaniibacteriota TaxID=1752723 RepID=A0A1F7IM43_9BACT|nr:MAG: hypothetical protein A3D06_00190 [Candidatus Roizmanbacteria bacterium RIFCSPHIGHO2_02_FULL_40_9]OGK44360.1 MAG: hypothetical protein A2957_00220 [Candidatus Roizmanbacteria bacterium RIFCSPLOWO2_01_FULL_38_11]
MDIKISPKLYGYISEGQKDLMREGFLLINYINTRREYVLKDYSFIVFPFAKAYEGFLKQIFLDAGFITEKDYISQHFRIGKVISPNLVRRLGQRSVYKKISDIAGSELSDEVWMTWKKGRNEVFHYFPHNLRSLKYPDARRTVMQIIKTMENALEKLHTDALKHRLNRYLE